MMEPSRHDKANVRVGPPYSQLKDIYLFIYLTKIGDFLNKIYNYKDTLHKALCISCSPRNFPII
jgi:hypothetical protein